MRVVSKVAMRGLRQRERMQKMAESKPVGIRIVPAKEEYRAVLKHPTGGGFPATGSKEWPDDRFTKRRLADGSVTHESSEARKADHHKGPPRQKPNEPPSNSAA
jgi:hypothetical protein